MSDLPEKVYYVVRHSNDPRPYYGRQDRRLYRGLAQVRAFTSAWPEDEFEVYEAEVAWRKVE